MSTLLRSPLELTVLAALKKAFLTASFFEPRYSAAVDIRKFALSPLDGRLSAALARTTSVSLSAFGARTCRVFVLSPLDAMLDSATPIALSDDFIFRRPRGIC